MNAWTRVNLLLGALAAILLALHLWPAPSPAQRPLTSLAPDAITVVRVERADRLELELQRGSDGWRLVYPDAAAAQERRVQQLLAIAQAPVLQHYAADAGALEGYGLDVPRAVLQFNATRLLFGERDPSQQLRYVLVDGEVRVIDDVYFNLLSLPARHFTGG